MRKPAGSAIFLLLPVLLLADCNPPAPPANTITPGAIDYLDITRHKLWGNGCNFAAEGGGMGAILLAQAERAVIKLDGKIVTIPADKTSARLIHGSWTRYTGPAFTIALTASGSVSANTFPARMTLTDGHGKTLFTAAGQAQCKIME